MLFSLESTVHPFIAHPSYAQIANKSLEEKVNAMKDESFKEQILSEEPAVDKNHMIYTLMTAFDNSSRWMKYLTMNLLMKQVLLV